MVTAKLILDLATAAAMTVAVVFGIRADVRETRRERRQEGR